MRPVPLNPLLAAVVAVAHVAAVLLAHPCACGRQAGTSAPDPAPKACCCGPEGGMACHDTGAPSPRSPAGKGPCSAAPSCPGMLRASGAATAPPPPAPPVATLADLQAVPGVPAPPLDEAVPTVSPPTDSPPLALLLKTTSVLLT